MSPLKSDEATHSSEARLAIVQFNSGLQIARVPFTMAQKISREFNRENPVDNPQSFS
jgi:hypothetical protein